MGFWPFGRKNRRSSRADEKLAVEEKANMTQRSSGDTQPPRPRGQGVVSPSKSSPPHQPRRLQRPAPKGHSMPPRAQTAPQSRPVEAGLSDPEKQLPEGQRALTSRATHHDRSDPPAYYHQNPMSHSSLGPESFSVVPRAPTLRAKRSSADQNFNRRKSSKRKAEDHAREQEIRAMSSPVPNRHSTRAGDPLRRDTKRVPGGLNRHLERPSSNISLPLVESLHESMSETSDSHTYTVNPFSALTPRPTLRYADSSRPGPLRSMNQSRASHRDKRPMIPEEDTTSKKRIDELADGLSASGLRELMERDQRRREKKRLQDQEKLQQKLERKAERQRGERKSRPERREDAEQVAPRHSDREEQGRRPLGLELDTGPSTQQKSGGEENPFDDNRANTPGSWLEDPSREHLPQAAPENPFRDSVSEPPFALQGTKPEAEHEELSVPIQKKESRLSQGSLSPATSPIRSGRGLSSTSQISGLGKELTLEIPEHDSGERRDSDPSSGRVSNWTSFFKRGGTRQKRASADRGIEPSSEFSNTSRESFSRQVPPPPIPPRSFRRSGGTPVRTMSKFREDLPEFPLSPPDSRIQSPETTTAIESSPAREERSSYGFGPVPQGESGDVSREMAHRSMETNASEPEPRSAALTRSMASVDSEASWLSGKPVKRTSLPSPQPYRESGSTLAKNLQEPSDAGEEDVTEDEYFTRLTPGPDTRRASRSAERRASSTAMGEKGDIYDDDNESIPPVPRAESPEEKAVHESIERHPTVVHAKPSARSREGLLQEFQENESDPNSPDLDLGATPEGETPVSEGEERWIHRATSVDYGKSKGHARHISAGSAKLLDLPQRGSVDMKRLSRESSKSKPKSEGPSTVAREES